MLLVMRLLVGDTTYVEDVVPVCESRLPLAS